MPCPVSNLRRKVINTARWVLISTNKAAESSHARNTKVIRKELLRAQRMMPVTNCRLQDHLYRPNPQNQHAGCSRNSPNCSILLVNSCY